MPLADDVYSVYLDGRPIHRGLTKEKAYAHAEYYSKNGERIKANDKRRFPEVAVRVDKHIVSQENEWYRQTKQGG